MLYLQAAEEERASRGKLKKQESDKDAMKHLTLGRSFLGLFRKENDTDRPSELEASKRNGPSQLLSGSKTDLSTRS